MFATHDYSVIVGWCLHHLSPYEYSSVDGWCLKHMIIESLSIDIWNIWLLSHGWLIFGRYDYSVMVGVVYIVEVLFAFLVLSIRDYFLLPSWSTGYLNLEYMISDFGDHVALHCIALHDIWSYVANVWLRPYQYIIVYWAQRCNFISCWVWR